MTGLIAGIFVAWFIPWTIRKIADAHRRGKLERDFIVARMRECETMKTVNRDRALGGKR